MRSAFLLVQLVLICLLTIAAKPHMARKPALKNKDSKILELKLKKELSDKKLSTHKKYTLTILAARELRQLNYQKESIQFYQMAKEIKVDENKKEIDLALSPNKIPFNLFFFFDVDLKLLIEKKYFEKAILSINPEQLNDPQNAKQRIVYDLLNVRIKKRSVKNLYCYQDYQKDPDTYYQYSNLICDFLLDYLRDGKGNDHIKIIEEYFLKHDQQEMHLVNLAKEIEANH